MNIIKAAVETFMTKENHPLKKKHNKLVRLRWYSRFIVLATVSFSTWANMLHADPNVASYLFAAAPPVIVLAGFEFISRIPFPEGTHMLKRLARSGAVMVIAGIGAYLSYHHQKDAINRYSSGDQQAANLLPIAIDGLMIIASVSLLTLNDLIGSLEAAIYAEEIKQARKDEVTPTPRRKSTKQSGRERVANILALRPDISMSELVKAAGVSESYAYTLRKELMAGDGAELGEVATTS